MRSVAVVAMLVLLLAGCLGTGNQSGPAATSGSTGPSMSASTTPATQPAPSPVHIHETGDFAAGADKTWTWTVGDGASKSTLTLCLDGPAGSPEWTANGMHYSLTGPGVDTSKSSGGTVSSESAGHECPLEEDHAGAGDWKMTFGLQGGAGTWTADVTVEY